MVDRPKPEDCIYGNRDPEAQGDHFMRHMDHMTRERLHGKAEIAEELAHRDIEIERLTSLLDAAKSAYDTAHRRNLKFTAEIREKNHEISNLRATLQIIAMQGLSGEQESDEGGDYEFAYDQMISDARECLERAADSTASDKHGNSE